VERDAFLSRVGQASLTSILPDPPPVPAELPELEPADLVALMRTNAQAVNAVVHTPVSRHGAARAVAAIATGHDASSFMAWDDLPVSGVASALSAAGMERVDHRVPPGDRRQHNLGYVRVDVGVTGARAGLAESGSLVLSHGPGRPRMASLIPEIHIALLETDRIARDLAHWAHEYPESAAETTNLVFVTGPSRTGDIEQQLNLGVHGPRTVHIVMVK
jgi:L-lactate dehydrogenase complex protein LldG